MTEVVQQCPAHKGSTTGSDSYSWNSKKKKGNCFSCGLKTWEFNGTLWGKHGSEKTFSVATGEPAGEREEEDRYMPKDIVEVPSRGSHKALRGITEDTMREWGVLFQPHSKWTAINPETKEYESGEADQYFFPYPQGYGKIKRTGLPKGHFAHFSSTLKSYTELFGMEKFPAGCSKKITITEGELDALSAWQILRSGKFINPVVSLPSANPSPKLWKSVEKYLDSFEEIILSVDADGPGKDVAKKLSLMFPGKVLWVNHGAYKDANDFLMHGDGETYRNLWWATVNNKKRFKPDDILLDSDDYLALYDESPDFEYFETGIPQLDEKILGINKGYFTVIQAPTGVGKCLHPDQGVLMWDGSTKKAKDVLVGDKLMGDDSTPRNVVGTTTGEEEMFEITPVKGDPWVCNKSHMLSVVNTSTGAKFEISVADYLNQNKTFKHEHKLYRTPVAEFGYRGEKTRFNPYLVGVYLGDGHTHRAAITLGPKKFGVMQYVEQCLSVTGHSVSLEDKGNCTELTFKGGTFWRYIKTYVHVTDRCIPNEFKFSKDYYRAALLAGLLDTDGSLTNGGVEITQKSETLANDIAFVARSLGLAAYVKPKVGEIKSLGFKGQYYRVGISGDFSSIPFRRLNVPVRMQVKDVLRTGFTVKPLGVGKYAGFELDGNHRFLLDDFTVTHNSEFMRYLEWQCLSKSEYKFAYMHLEESRLRSVLGLASYKLGANVTLKKFIEDRGLDAEVREAINWLSGSERMIQFSYNPEDGYESLLDKIKYLVAAFEVDYVFFEPIQDVVNGDDKEGKLADLSSRLGTMASDLGVGIVTIAHQNQNGDTMYATMIGKKAAFEIILYRDQEAEDTEEKNTTHIKVGRKNRVGLGNGPAGKLKFNHDSYTLTPILPPEEPKPNVEDDF